MEDYSFQEIDTWRERLSVSGIDASACGPVDTDVNSDGLERGDTSPIPTSFVRRRCGRRGERRDNRYCYTCAISEWLRFIDELIDRAEQLTENELTQGEVVDELNVSRETASWFVGQRDGATADTESITTSPTDIHVD